MCEWWLPGKLYCMYGSRRSHFWLSNIQRIPRYPFLKKKKWPVMLITREYQLFPRWTGKVFGVIALVLVSSISFSFGVSYRNLFPIFWADFAFGSVLLPHVTLCLFPSFGWNKRIRVMAYSFIVIIKNERYKKVSWV